MNILFVCTGNTCRSPMAQGILQDMAQKKGLDIKVKSAGIYALDGQSPSTNAIKVLKSDNIDINNHRASIVHRDLLEEADLILTMGNSHKEILISKFDFIKDKIYTLKEFSYGVKEDIVDPFGGDINVYNNTKNELYNALEKIIEKLMKGEY
ncbi:MAG: low molecular weight protein arginine phosphatase [Tissierellia bacterium]|nr:low molecular weight protein arginine phosphatase [Tissierellia bacterium]